MHPTKIKFSGGGFPMAAVGGLLVEIPCIGNNKLQNVSRYTSYYARNERRQIFKIDTFVVFIASRVVMITSLHVRNPYNVP
jgi:hypothetical protein